MGSRNRRNPAEHAVNGKGAPTPPAPQNTPAPARPARVTMILHADNVAPRIQPHPEVAGGVLDLIFSFGASLCTIRVPAAAWPTIRDSVDKAVAEAAPEALEAAAEAQRAAASGIVLPGSVNIDETAEAHAKADRDLRGGPPA